LHKMSREGEIRNGTNGVSFSNSSRAKWRQLQTDKEITQTLSVGEPIRDHTKYGRFSQAAQCP
jgi:hypothetical protein